MVATLIYNAGAADKMEGATIPLGPDVVDFTLMEPLGVTAHIVPWNYPLSMAARSLGAGAGRRLHGRAQAGRADRRSPRCGSPSWRSRPASRRACSTSSPASARRPGRRWSATRWCAAITFTGSVPTGRAIMAMAAERTIPVVLELGGKNAVLVFADADLDRVVADVADGAFENAGQVCSVGVQAPGRGERRRRSWSSGSPRAPAGSRVGPGSDDPDLGPLVSDEQHAQVSGFIAEAKRRGAPRPRRRPPRRTCRAATSSPRRSSTSCRPKPASPARRCSARCVTITRFATEPEALAIANGTGYGLVAGVYTRDISRALRLAKQLEAGSVWINGWFIGGQQAPTGGIKDSGIGRERGLPGVRNYLQIKNVGIRL